MYEVRVSLAEVARENYGMAPRFNVGAVLRRASVLVVCTAVVFRPLQFDDGAGVRIGMTGVQKRRWAIAASALATSNMLAGYGLYRRGCDRPE